MVLKSYAYDLKSKLQYNSTKNFAMAFGSKKISYLIPTVCANVAATKELDSIACTIACSLSDKFYWSGEITSHEFYPVTLGSVF